MGANNKNIGNPQLALDGFLHGRKRNLNSTRHNDVIKASVHHDEPLTSEMASIIAEIPAIIAIHHETSCGALWVSNISRSKHRTGDC
jgi:hypothetical protein